MENRFWETINKYMLPMDRLDRVVDSSYLLRKNLSLAFAQGYWHPKGAFIGKMINYPDDKGMLDIFGRRYSNTNKRRVDNELRLIPIEEQILIHYTVEPGLKEHPPLPPFAEYHTVFRLDDCLGFFDHRHSLMAAMEMYPRIATTIRKISEFLELPLSQLGVTGSLAYGRIEDEHEDIDLTIHGDLEQNHRISKKITDWIREPVNRVVEFGKFWPMRFYYDGTLVCPFFIYNRENEIPLAELIVNVLKNQVSFKGRVSDDRHSIYLPMLIELKGVTVDGKKESGIPLIIYDSSIRGEFLLGDTVEGNAKLVDLTSPGRNGRALLVTSGAAIHKAI